MTSAAASAPFTPFSGPFAIGTLSAPGETRFPGLVTPEGRALDLRTALDDPALTTLTLLERWDEELPRLHTLAGDPTRGWRPLADLAVHAPVEPRQIFQSGANYRRHVIDLAVAHRAP
ncbi:hydrolase, partial [Streptomyces sp. ADMS]|nr:hydrolase [Streptomyces sp. ADMS]